MLALIVMCLATVPPAFVACANQAQGQRCDTQNANEDCEPGLYCRSRTELGGASDICCAKNDQGNWVLTPYDCEPHANTGAGGAGGASSSSAAGMGGAGGASSSSASSSSASSSATSSSASSSSSGGQDAGSG